MEDLGNRKQCTRALGEYEEVGKENENGENERASRILGDRMGELLLFFLHKLV